MTTVDPYVVRIPDKFTRQDGTLTPEGRAWYDYDNRWKHDLWRLVTGGTGSDTGGSIGESSANENQIGYLLGLVAELRSKVEDLQSDSYLDVNYAKDFNNITKTTSYTAVDHDFINAKSGVTITLPATPEVNSVIIVRNGDSTAITINANGKTINGSATAKILRKGTALVLHYFIDSDEWLIR